MHPVDVWDEKGKISSDQKPDDGHTKSDTKKRDNPVIDTRQLAKAKLKVIVGKLSEWIYSND